MIEQLQSLFKEITRSLDSLIGNYIDCFPISQIHMLGSKQDIQIDEAITYSLATDSFSKPLKLTNKSNHIYVFKIKTNQRSVISMQVTHDFIKPNSVKDIIIKLAEKPSETTPLRLELNYVVPTQQEIRLNDSKMASYGRDAVYKKIITINRDDSVKPAVSLTSSFSLDKSKEEVNLNDQSGITNISAVSTKELKKEEKVEIKKENSRVEVKKQENIEKKQERKEEKPEPRVVTPIKYPDLSYVRQVESQQISVFDGKSQEIDVTALIQAPLSSQQAINIYKSSGIDKINQNIESKIEVRPVIVIPNEEKAENFTLAASSPAGKKISFSSDRFRSQEVLSLSQLNQKLENEKKTIQMLRNERNSELKSDCVFPMPIIYLLVLAAFFGGALLSWILI